MRIWTLSDIHTEFGTWAPPTIPDADICVLAGDIAAGAVPAIDWSHEHVLPHMPVVQVLGNHEFYGSSIERELNLAREYAPRAGVKLLENEAVVLDGVRFLGCTLWTDFDLLAKGNPGGQQTALAAARSGMNDFARIKLRDFSKDRFHPEDAKAMHEASVAWLEAELATPHDGETVVVTHHGPSPRSVHQRFAADPLTASFASDLEWLIERYQPSLWLHGHTHDSYDYDIGATRVVCNPRGYPPERRAKVQTPENLAFDPAMVIEVGEPKPKPPGM